MSLSLNLKVNIWRQQNYNVLLYCVIIICFTCDDPYSYIDKNYQKDKDHDQS